MSKVYILKDAKGVTKIGFSGVAAESRRKTLSSTMCSDFSVVAFFDSPKTPARSLEKMVHNLCSDYRIAAKDCNGENCFEFYKLPDEVLAFAILYLAEATGENLDYHEFARNNPYRLDVKKVLKSIKSINAAIEEGFVLKSGRSIWAGSNAFDTLLPEEVQKGISYETAYNNIVSNKLIMRFNSENVSQFRFTQKEQKEMPTFQAVKA